VLVSDASLEVDVSDVDPPELVLLLEPELELDEDEYDDAGSDADVGPTPKLDSPGAFRLQASVDTDAGATSVAAARKMRADMTARGYRGALVTATRGVRLKGPRCCPGAVFAALVLACTARLGARQTDGRTRHATEALPPAADIG
jgi:hypothetical protein